MPQWCTPTNCTAAVVSEGLGTDAGRPFDRTTALGAVFADELPEWVYDPKFQDLLAGDTGGFGGDARS